MKVLVLIRSYDQNLGGMEAHTRTLVEHFTERGWHVTVATPRLKHGEPQFALHGVNVLRIGRAPNPVLKYSISYWFRVRQLLMNNGAKYDVICNIGMTLSGSFFLPKRIKNKVVTIFHGTYFLERGTLYARIRSNGPDIYAVLGIPYTYIFSFLQRLIIRRSNKVISVSRGVEENLLAMYDLQPDRSLCIPNFVDTQVFNPKQHQSRRKVRLLFLSRIHKEKGILQLVNALDDIKKTRPQVYHRLICTFVGEGPDLEQLRRRVAELGLTSITFEGRAQHQDIPNLLKQADIFLFPTLRNEGLPLALLEAMSSGLPCIASSVEGVTEVIDDNKTGLLCLKGSASELADKIAYLIENPDLINSYGTAARKKIERNHSKRRALGRFDKAFLDTAKESKRTPLHNNKYPYIFKNVAIYAAVALVILAPLLSSGYIFALDMVFTPHIRAAAQLTNSYLLQQFLHVLNYAIPSQVIEKLLLFSILILSGLGMHRLIRYLEDRSTQLTSVAPYFAGIMYTINPFTYDRFMIGQYDFLLGYALLPWFMQSLIRFLAKPGPGRSITLALWGTLISIVSIHSAGLITILAFIAFTVTIIMEHNNHIRVRMLFTYTLLSMMTFLVLSSYWLIPLLYGHTSTAHLLQRFNTSDIAAFATAGGTVLHRFLNVVRLQGLWAEPRDIFRLPQYIIPVWNLLAIAFWSIIIAGLASYIRARDTFMAIFLGSVAILTALLAIGVFSQWLYDYVPFYRGFREPEKFSALLALVLIILSARGISSLIRYCRSAGGTICVVSASILLLIFPFVWTPSMLWGFNGQLQAANYPADWYVINNKLDHDRSHFQTLFLPWHLYMYFDFAGRVISTPAVSFFDRPVIVSDNPEFQNISLVAPTSSKAGINNLLLSPHTTSLGKRLALYNVKYVLLAKDDDYRTYAYLDKQSDMKLIYAGDTLKLYRNEAWREK